MKPNPHRIIGIDPGYGRMGWAILEVIGSRQTLLASGCIHTSSKLSESARIVALYDQLGDILRTWHPTIGAIEKLYFQKNATTAIGVGQARGVALLVCGQHRVTIREFSPSNVKLATTGYGRADKRQVGRMVQAILKLPSAPQNDDEADAIAIALCATTNSSSYAA